nr:PREDICTED: uncharacterized protein LOC108202332 isoform X2 [Daucus carota subsp. sativus]
MVSYSYFSHRSTELCNTCIIVGSICKAMKMMLQFNTIIDKVHMEEGKICHFWMAHIYLSIFSFVNFCMTLRAQSRQVEPLNSCQFISS